MITEIINLTSHFDFLWISPHNNFQIYISLELYNKMYHLQRPSEKKIKSMLA